MMLEQLVPLLQWSLLPPQLHTPEEQVCDPSGLGHWLPPEGQVHWPE
jgi:hypothetical protein